MRGEVALAGATHVGLVREANEDRHGAQLLDHARGVMVVADGMGGHVGGETAARIAVNMFVREIAFGGVALGCLRRAIEHANLAVHQEGNLRPSLHGMGCTIVAALYDLERAKVTIGHVGDSRAYWLPSKGQPLQLTEDHSVRNEQIRAGLPVSTLAPSNYLARAIGTKPSVEIDLMEIEITKPGTLLLCSDGLSGLIPDEQIHKLANGTRTDEASIEVCAQRLVKAALDAGGTDNVTVVLAKFR